MGRYDRHSGHAAISDHLPVLGAHLESEEGELRALGGHTDLIAYEVVPNGVGASRRGQDNSEAPKQVVRLDREYVLGRFGRIPDPHDTYFAAVHGDSMEPYIRDGSQVCAQKVRGIRDAGRYLLSYDGHEEFCKRVTRQGRKRLLVESDNKAYAPQRLEWLEDDEYRDLDSGDTLSLYVHGRVIDPPDTNRAVLGEVIDAFARALGRTPHS